jgi:hypothetical protein
MQDTQLIIEVGATYVDRLGREYKIDDTCNNGAWFFSGGIGWGQDGRICSHEITTYDLVRRIDVPEPAIVDVPECTIEAQLKSARDEGYRAGLEAAANATQAARPSNDPFDWTDEAHHSDGVLSRLILAIRALVPHTQADSKEPSATLFRQRTPGDGVIRLEKWPEGYILWYHGEIVWRSYANPVDDNDGHAARLEKLKNIRDIQCSKGNYDVDEYMRGLANGLILSVSAMEDSNPKFIETPAPADDKDARIADLTNQLGTVIRAKNKRISELETDNAQLEGETARFVEIEHHLRAFMDAISDSGCTVRTEEIRKAFSVVVASGLMQRKPDDRDTRIAELEKAVAHAAAAFRWYEQAHMKKSDDEKAQRNREFAEMCEAALEASGLMQPQPAGVK